MSSNKNFMNTIQVRVPKGSIFDLTHDVKMSLDMGNLYPTLCMECSPGDKIRVGNENLLRFMPMIAPVMQRFQVTNHYFFVPYRLLWQNWETYITNGGDNPNEGGPLPAFPYRIMNRSNWTPLADYLGVPPPPDDSSPLPISAMPFAAYQKIYDDYYRDENLIDKVFSPLLDGENTSPYLFELRKRAWKKDLFTSALPFAQKGAPVELPLGDFSDVQVQVNNMASPNTTLTGSPEDVIAPTGTTSNPDISDNWLFAKTSEMITGTITINDLRTAKRLQEWLEKSARGGTRYSESLRVHFNVIPEDARLQRAEYITGTISPVVISEVLNTTGTADAPQGNMSGHGLSVTSGNQSYYKVKEHGVIMCIMSVMPEASYQQGLAKMWLKINDPKELHWTDFNHLGEQEVKVAELYAFHGETDDDTFGYQPIYYEYRNIPNRVAGQVRSNLSFWTMSRIFNTPPALNRQFIECNPDKSIFAVQDPEVDSLVAHIIHKIKAFRLLPKFGTPTF